MTENFYIKKGSELPLLVMKSSEYNYFKYESFDDYIRASDIIYFYLYDTEGNCLFVDDRVYITPINGCECCDLPEHNYYYIVFKFNKRMTRECGQYIGKFKVIRDDIETILPIKNTLLINII